MSKVLEGGGPDLKLVYAILMDIFEGGWVLVWAGIVAGVSVISADSGMAAAPEVSMQKVNV
jgi:hypothetical protein